MEKSTKCKSCKREVPANATFCPWCGKRQVKEKKADGAIKVPEPKKLPSGNWTIYLRAEKQSITEATKEKCITKAKAVRAGFVEKQKEAPAITWSKAIDLFIQDRSESLSPETVRGYRIIQRNRFKSVMNKPMNLPVNWQAEINSALSSLSDKTVSNSWGLMSEIMRVNRMEVPNILMPSAKKPAGRDFLDPQQIISFCDAIRGDTCEIAMLLGLHSLRMSEIKALKMSENIDLKNNLIHVSGAMVRDEKNKSIYKDRNKTTASNRIIPIMIPRLAELLAQCKDANGFLVLQLPSTVNKHIHAAADRAELPNITSHCLRHSFVSLGYHLRLSELEVMEMGGWSDNQIVHRIYLHLARRDRLKAGNKMAKFYRTAEKISSSKKESTDKQDT